MAKLLTKKLFELYDALGISLTAADTDYIRENLSNGMHKECKQLVSNLLFQEAVTLTLNQLNAESHDKLTQKEFRDCLKRGFYKKEVSAVYNKLLDANLDGLVQTAIDNMDLQVAFIIENFDRTLTSIYPDEVADLNRIANALHDLCFKTRDEIDRFIFKAEAIIAGLQKELEPIRKAIIKLAKSSPYNKAPGYKTNLKAILKHLSDNDTILQNLDALIILIELLKLPKDTLTRIKELQYVLEHELAVLAGINLANKENIIEDIFTPTLAKLKRIVLIMYNFRITTINNLLDMDVLSDQVAHLRETFNRPNDLINVAIIAIHLSCKVLYDNPPSLTKFLKSFDVESSTETALVPSATERKSMKQDTRKPLTTGTGMIIERILMKVIDWRLQPSEVTISRLKEEQHQEYQAENDGPNPKYKTSRLR